MSGVAAQAAVQVRWTSRLKWLAVVCLHPLGDLGGSKSSCRAHQMSRSYAGKPCT